MPRRTPNAIRSRREGRGLLQARLARALRTDVPRVSQLEAGYMLPTGRELAALCRVLKCRPGDLYSKMALALIREEEDGAWPVKSRPASR